MMLVNNFYLTMVQYVKGRGKTRRGQKHGGNKPPPPRGSPYYEYSSPDIMPGITVPLYNSKFCDLGSLILGKYCTFVCGTLFGQIKLI
jgi:hypothetical protein